MSAAACAQRFPLNGVPTLPVVGAPSREGSHRLDPVSTARVQNAPVRSLLVQSALLAELHGLRDEAEAIRPVVLSLGVDQVMFDVARAVIALNRGDPSTCAQIIERNVLLTDPGHQVARAVLVCAWRDLGRSDWRGRANALLAAATHPLAKNILARSVARGAPHTQTPTV